MESLWEYVLEHTERGQCQCGKCYDVDPSALEPIGHTVDMVFFKVAKKGNPEKDQFIRLCQEHKGEFCSVDVSDGLEHRYMELGGWLGDQGLALLFMGLGSLLDAFCLLTPFTILGNDTGADMAMQMAGAGMVSIKSKS